MLHVIKSITIIFTFFNLGLRPSPNSSSNISSVLPTPPTSSLLPTVTSNHHIPEEDAASDVSCLSDRKPDTEGEETDTAPEAEAVNNGDQFDHYGDYVTRCIWYVL